MPATAAPAASTTPFLNQTVGIDQITPTMKAVVSSLAPYFGAIGSTAGAAYQTVNPGSTAPTTSDLGIFHFLTGRTGEDYIFMLLGALFVIVGIFIAVFSSRPGTTIINTVGKAATAAAVV